MRQWKYFEDRSTSGEDMGKSWRLTFWRTLCIVYVYVSDSITSISCGFVADLLLAFDVLWICRRACCTAWVRHCMCVYICVCVLNGAAWRRRRRMLRRLRQRLRVDDGTSSSAARRLMQCVHSAATRRQRRPAAKDVDSCPCDNIAMTDDHQGERSSCCRCSDGGGSGSADGGGRLARVVDSCRAGDGCRLPRCKWWKSLCTRVYLIAINLASFVSVCHCTTCKISKVRLYYSAL